MLEGFERGLGAKAASLIIAKEPYDREAPVIDSQIIKLKTSNADVLVDFSTPKFTVQAIKKTRELGWQPLRPILSSVSNSIGTVLSVAGLEDSVRIISSGYYKDPADSSFAGSGPGRTQQVRRQIHAGHAEDRPDGERLQHHPDFRRGAERCGDDLTRENVMKQAANLKDVELPLFLPGIKINTSATDYYPIESLQMLRFDGKRWARSRRDRRAHGELSHERDRRDLFRRPRAPSCL